MRPHLVRWDKAYGDKGLVIIDVDNGRIDTKEAVTEHATEEGVGYRTIWDEEGRLCATYGIRGYPSAFLLDTAGEVIWEGFPLPNVETLEALFEEHLETVAEELRCDPDSAPEGSSEGEDEGGMDR